MSFSLLGRDIQALMPLERAPPERSASAQAQGALEKARCDLFPCVAEQADAAHQLTTDHLGLKVQVLRPLPFQSHHVSSVSGGPCAPNSSGVLYKPGYLPPCTHLQGLHSGQAAGRSSSSKVSGIPSGGWGNGAEAPPPPRTGQGAERAPSEAPRPWAAGE